MKFDSKNQNPIDVYLFLDTLPRGRGWLNSASAVLAAFGATFTTLYLYLYALARQFGVFLGRRSSSFIRNFSVVLLLMLG